MEIAIFFDTLEPFSMISMIYEYKKCINNDLFFTSDGVDKSNYFINWWTLMLNDKFYPAKIKGIFSTTFDAVQYDFADVKSTFFC